MQSVNQTMNNFCSRSTKAFVRMRCYHQPFRFQKTGGGVVFFSVAQQKVLLRSTQVWCSWFFFLLCSHSPVHISLIFSLCLGQGSRDSMCAPWSGHQVVNNQSSPGRGSRTGFLVAGPTSKNALCVRSERETHCTHISHFERHRAHIWAKPVDCRPKIRTHPINTMQKDSHIYALTMRAVPKVRTHCRAFLLLIFVFNKILQTYPIIVFPSHGDFVHRIILLICE